jgi:hypothetical protein
VFGPGAWWMEIVRDAANGGAGPRPVVESRLRDTEGTSSGEWRLRCGPGWRVWAKILAATKERIYRPKEERL